MTTRAFGKPKKFFNRENEVPGGLKLRYFEKLYNPHQSKNKMPCFRDFELLLGCLTKNEFKNDLCSQELAAFNACYATSLQKGSSIKYHMNKLLKRK